MAVDHALLESVQREHAPVLRLYRWQPACLSFGRNQPAVGVYEAGAKRLGLDVVRRPTGGMAVLHDQEVTYSFSAPFETFGGPRASYVTVNRALVAGLRRLGVPAELAATVRRSPFGSMHPCFAEPAAGEVIAHGRKLVGSAQRCEHRTLLQHGSVLLDGSQDQVAQLSSSAIDLAARATSVRELIGRVPDLSKIVNAIAAGFEEVGGICLAPTSLSQSDSDRATELEYVYRSAEWTWRK